FYPDATQEDLRATTCDFYDKFYEIKLTNAQIEAMLGPAGAPPQDAPRPVGEPLVGLGAAPPSTLPPGTPGAVPGMPTPAGAGQKDTCVVPHGPSPQPLLPSLTAPGINPLETPAPGVPP